MDKFEWNENIPVTANNLNEMQDIINNNIKIDYITQEVKTNNKWIDGKPIYRRCFSFVPMSADIYLTIGTMNYVDTVISINGSSTTTDNYRTPLIFSEVSNPMIPRASSLGLVKYKTDNSHLSTNTVIIIEYTKTTD